MTGALPRWLWVPISLALGLVGLPLAGVVARIPWADLVSLLTSLEALEALRLSLWTCLISALVSLLLGVPLAFALARGTGRWVPLARTVTTLPMVLPPVVAGLALLVTFGRRGLIGAPLAAAGIEIGFTTVAVVMAQVFVSMPYLVIAVEGALRTAGSDHEHVAASLGASPTRVFLGVSLPMLMPALASGTALAFARSLGEFGATLTFAGSLQGTTRTLPLEIYLQRETDTDTALALSVVLIAIAILVVGGTGWVSKRWGRHA